MMNGGLAPTDSTISHKNPLQMCEKEGKAPGERLPSTIKCFENAKTTHVMIKQKRGNASSLASSPKPWQISVEARGMAQTGWGHDSVPGDSSEYGASCSTGLDPPITRESLSELDLPRILNHLSLRHDLNFDREISFRSNMSGPRGRQRAKQAFEYWDAMAAELAVWFDYRQIPLRLPRMFGAVRQILKTLIPAQEWPEIDIWLDIESLMQGMRNGSFNFTALIEWLGALLRRSCSPVRDHLVDLMISTTERGMQRADPCLITDGLLHLFGILERMRLDLADHQFRCLRQGLVDESVNFEQSEFLCRIAKGWDLSEGRTWYEALESTDEQQRTRSSSKFLAFLEAVSDHVITSCDVLPETFALDWARLRTLQDEFQSLMYQAACRWTFRQTLRFLEENGLKPALSSQNHGVSPNKNDVLGSSPPFTTMNNGITPANLAADRGIAQQAYDDLYYRVSIIATAGDLSYNRQRQTEIVALEIARHAYRMCNIHSVPNSEVLASTERYLEENSDPLSNVFEDSENFLGDQLQALVEQEAEAIQNLTPVQMMNRQLPREFSQGTDVNHERMSLASIAKRIAHIAVLHWRVWTPILYEQPLSEQCNIDRPTATDERPPTTVSPSTIFTRVDTNMSGSHVSNGKPAESEMESGKSEGPLSPA